MPKLLGLEPSTVQKAKPILLIGGGGLLLYFILKGRGTPPVAAEAPSGAAPPAGVVSPAAQPDLTQSGGVVSALQQQMQQHQLEYDVAASNLALQGQHQQLQFAAQEHQQAMAQQTEQNYYQNKLAHEELRKAQGKNQGGFLGGFFDLVGKGLGVVGKAEQVYSQFQSIPTKRPGQEVQPPFYPTPTGRYPGS